MFSNIMNIPTTKYAITINGVNFIATEAILWIPFIITNQIRIAITMPLRSIGTPSNLLITNVMEFIWIVEVVMSVLKPMKKAKITASHFHPNPYLM